MVVSWLLVALTPGLLMLATFGLERLEAGLEKDTVTATDVAQFLEQAEPADVGTLARDGMPEALDGMHRRINREASTLPEREQPATDPRLPAIATPGAHTPVGSHQRHRHSGANRQFAPRQPAHPV